MWRKHFRLYHILRPTNTWTCLCFAGQLFIFFFGKVDFMVKCASLRLPLFAVEYKRCIMWLKGFPFFFFWSFLQLSVSGRNWAAEFFNSLLTLPIKAVVTWNHSPFAGALQIQMFWPRSGWVACSLWKLYSTLTKVLNSTLWMTLCTIHVVDFQFIHFFRFYQSISLCLLINGWREGGRHAEGCTVMCASCRPRSKSVALAVKN